MAKLSAMLEDRLAELAEDRRFSAGTVQKDRVVEVLSGTAIWGTSATAAVPIRWVLVRDPAEEVPAAGILVDRFFELICRADPGLLC